MNERVFKTWAYNVRDIETKEEFTIYWCSLAGLDFWNDFGMPHTPPKNEPNKLPADYYELLSKIYEVEVTYYPMIAARTEIKKL